jgi:hypothetical protein
MINSTNIKVPKKYHHMIKEIYKDDDGYWVILNDGFYAAGYGPYDEFHTIHEDTVSEVLYHIRQLEHV